MAISLVDSILAYRLGSVGLPVPSAIDTDNPTAPATDAYSALAPVQSTVSALSGYGQLLSAAARFQDNFTKPDAPAVSSNTSALTITGVASDSTTPTASTVQVKKVAKAQEQQSTATADPAAVRYGSGKFTLKVLSNSGATVSSSSITIAAGQGSLNGIRDAINAKNVGVTASVEQGGSGYYLSIKSNQVGASGNTFAISTTSSRTGFKAGLTALGLTQTQAKQDALYNVNGSGSDISSATNDVQIGGVKVTLTGVGTSNIVLPSSPATKNADIATATATGSAALGEYSVAVTQIAKSKELKSTAAAIDPTLAQFGTGAFTIQTTGASSPTTVNVKTGSLNGIRDAINSANAGVTASVSSDAFGYYLSIKGRSGAAAGDFTIDASLDPFTSFRGGLNALGLRQISTPQDAQFTITKDPTTPAVGQVKTTDPFASSSTAINGGTGGTFTIQASDASSPTTITVANGNDTLDGIRDAINAANAGVTASVTNSGSDYYLAIKGNQQGASAATFTVTAGTFDLTALTDLATTQSPADAVGGTVIANTTSATNTYTAGNGAVFTLTGTGTTTISIAREYSEFKKGAQNFISNYNALISTLNTLTATGGALDPAGGDTTAQTFRSDLYNRISTAQTSNGQSSLLALSSLGITPASGTSSSALSTLNETTLSAAYTSDPSGATSLLETYTTQLRNIVDSYAGISGSILNNNSSAATYQFNLAKAAVNSVSNGTDTLQDLINAGALPNNLSDLLANRILLASGQINAAGLSTYA